MPPALLHCLSPYDGPGVLCRAAYLLTLQSWAAALQVFTSVKLPKSAFGGHKDKSNSLSNDRTSYIWRQVLPQFPLLRVSSSTSSRCSLLRSGFLTSASWGHLPQVRQDAAYKVVTIMERKASSWVWPKDWTAILALSHPLRPPLQEVDSSLHTDKDQN